MSLHRRSLVQEFAGAERRRGMAETTIDKRSAIVRRWADFIVDPFAADVSWRHVEHFLDASSMRAAVSRYAAVSHLHVFYLWAMRAELADGDPTALVVRPRIRPALPRPAADVDVAVAVALAPPLERAAIVLGAMCGLRTVEMARLRWCDVGDDRIRVRGKGDRERVIPLPEPARDALEHLERVGHRLNRLFRELGLSITAHQLRHWCGTRAYAACGDLGTVQDYLGHASPVTTRIYAQLDPSRLRVVADALSMPTLTRPTVPAGHQ